MLHTKYLSSIDMYCNDNDNKSVMKVTELLKMYSKFIHLVFLSQCSCGFHDYDPNWLTKNAFHYQYVKTPL